MCAVMIQRRVKISWLLSIFVSSLACLELFVPAHALAQSYHRIQIANDADDGYYDDVISIGWHGSAAADLVGSWGGTTAAFAIGYRFPSTGINSGDPIQSAYLELVSSDSNPSNATCGSAPCANTNSTFRVFGVAQDNGSSFSNTSGNTPLDVQ